LQLIELLHARLPQFQEHARGDPVLKAIMGGGVGAEVGGVQGGPLTAGAQHVEDGVGTLAIRDPGPAPAKPMGVSMLGE
jgi:hypothetical protein